MSRDSCPFSNSSSIRERLLSNGISLNLNAFERRPRHWALLFFVLQDKLGFVPFDFCYLGPPNNNISHGVGFSGTQGVVVGEWVGIGHWYKLSISTQQHKPGIDGPFKKTNKQKKCPFCLVLCVNLPHTMRDRKFCFMVPLIAIYRTSEVVE